MLVKLLDSKKNEIKELEEKFPDIFLEGDILKDYNNNPFTNYLVYLIDDKIVGFINYYVIYDRAEIVNFSVLKYFRNNKIGSKLLIEMIYNLPADIKNITLEVRKDNDPAIHLYEKFGFKKVAVRKKYYNDVDGILMEKEMI